MKRTFGSTLKQLRLERSMSQEEFARLLGTTKQVISRYENDQRTPKITIANEYANLLDIPLTTLLGDESDVGGDTPLLPFGAVPVDLHCVAPVLGTVRAGQPIYAQENIEEYLPISFRDGAKYFFLHVCGDSMNAAGMDDGDLILVRSQPEVEDGQLAVVCVNGDEATVKYYRREGDLVVLTPKSFNQEYQTQIYSLKDVPVHICGLVVQIIKTVG